MKNAHIEPYNDNKTAKPFVLSFYLRLTSPPHYLQDKNYVTMEDQIFMEIMMFLFISVKSLYCIDVLPSYFLVAIEGVVGLGPI